MVRGTALNGARTSTTHRHGWAAGGHCCVSAVPHGHWRTTAFPAGLRCRGLTVPLVVDGPSFLAYIREFLCPTLTPGDIVIADNRGSHKVASVRDAIEAAWATLRDLPPYSPDLNLIEKRFAKIKTLLRKEAIRTVDALWNIIGTVTEAFTPDECSNHFASCGYVSQ